MSGFALINFKIKILLFLLIFCKHKSKFYNRV
jgi:hypothetical protein